MAEQVDSVLDKDPRCVSIEYPERLKLSDLLKQLEKIGPVIEFHLLENIARNRRKIILCRFDTAQQANEAKAINRWKTDSSMPAITKIFSRTPTWTRNFVNKNINNRKTSKTRIFCRLPYNIEENQRERTFFAHFMEFGTMLYHQVIVDSKGRWSYGYVQYKKKPEDASNAIKKSNSIYGAKYADERIKKHNQKNETKYYWVCTDNIDSDIYELHDVTCRWQHEKSMLDARKETLSKNKGHIRESNNITIQTNGQSTTTSSNATNGQSGENTIPEMTTKGTLV